MPASPSTVTEASVPDEHGGVVGADDTGDAVLARRDGDVAQGVAGVGDDSGGDPEQGRPGGDVMVVTRTSPGSSRSASARSRITRAGPLATPGAPARPEPPVAAGTVSGPVLPMTVGGVTASHRSWSARRAATARRSSPVGSSYSPG